jgi:GxxExxY protein
MTQKDTSDPRTYAIIGAAIQVRGGLGCGFLESVYQEALALEFARQQVPFAAQVELPIAYRGSPLKATFRADFICFDEVIVEVKALSALSGIEDAQVINYLKATGLHLGLLLNFGSRSLQHRRLVLSNKESLQSAESADDVLGRPERS